MLKFINLGANVEPIRADGAFKEFHDNRGLFALCNGTVRYTQEIFVPIEGTLDVSKKRKKKFRYEKVILRW